MNTPKMVMFWKKKVKSFYVVASKEVTFNSVRFTGFRGIPQFSEGLTLFLPTVSFDPSKNVRKPLVF